MAIYKRTWRPYSGTLTPDWSRFLILYRASSRTLFQSKAITSFFVLCFVFPLLCLLGIYANEHLGSLSLLIGKAPSFLTVDGNFFYTFLNIQGAMAFLLTAFIGPGLVSPDLANGALPLYLCRPLSRSEYVLGKMSTLAITLSWVTWVPGLILFAVQSSLGGWSWMTQNFWIARGIVLGSVMWIVVLSLLSLAISAWVKWRIAAGALLLAIFFMGSGFAHAVNAVLRTQQGFLIDLSNLASVVWRDLMLSEEELPMPAGEAWTALAACAGLCLFLVLRKIRANEVTR